MRNLPSQAEPSELRDLVVYLAQRATYEAVRSAAMIALQSPRGDEAIREFFAVGWGQAQERAQLDQQMHRHIVARVLATHSPEYSPQVVASARAAERGTDAERAEYVRSGFRVAQERDQATRDADGQAAAALRDADRCYVRGLREVTGAQVRLAATYATREGATDSDIIQFFHFSWASGARLDTEDFRLTAEAQEVRQVAAIERLTREARAAQKAAESAGDAAKEAMRRQAADAWGRVATGGAPAVGSWQQAQQVADAQASFWGQVYRDAVAQSSMNWRPVMKSANAARTDWRQDTLHAQQQVSFWRKLIAEAKEREEQLRPVSG
ncbi:hypothetical protein [Pilimelia terevasa]|nr:hypothetical protein [Pilimelia terevasa]